jgi:hypothetical protein
MKIYKLDLADFDLVEIKTTNECSPKPHCKKHGAMNKITKDGVWRCISVSGYKRVSEGNSKGLLHQETICRAGCRELTSNTDNKL